MIYYWPEDLPDDQGVEVGTVSHQFQVGRVWPLGKGPLHLCRHRHIFTNIIPENKIFKLLAGRHFKEIPAAEELDGVGPVDNKPSTDQLHQQKQKPVFTGDGFLPEPWRISHRAMTDFSTDPQEEKADLLSDEGVCRTAPATPGLLKIWSSNMQWFFNYV